LIFVVSSNHEDFVSSYTAAGTSSNYSIIQVFHLLHTPKTGEQKSQDYVTYALVLCNAKKRKSFSFVSSNENMFEGKFIF
jgi:hypothetical protein